MIAVSQYFPILLTKHESFNLSDIFRLLKITLTSYIGSVSSCSHWKLWHFFRSSWIRSSENIWNGLSSAQGCQKKTNSTFSRYSEVFFHIFQREKTACVVTHPERVFRRDVSSCCLYINQSPLACESDHFHFTFSESLQRDTSVAYMLQHSHLMRHICIYWIPRSTFLVHYSLNIHLS